MRNSFYAHPPYDQESFARALRQGIEPGAPASSRPRPAGR